MQHLTAPELSTYLTDHPQAIVVDVRESDELVHGIIEGAVHIPMQTIPASLDQLGDKDSQAIVVVCHAGVRSQHVAQYLEGMGYAHIYNLLGGMNSWAMEVDSSVAVY